MAKDLTTCKPASGLIKFAVPLILGQLLQQLYNLVDSIIVGRYVGSNALAAVGSSTAIIFVFTCISIGGSIGASVIMSQFFGAKRYGEMMTAIKTALVSFFVIGAVLMTIGLTLHRPLLHLMATPDEVFEDSALYMRIYFYGFLFVMMFNACNSVFNALGDSRKPLIFLAISAVMNVFLNILFVTKLGMGVDGVAWATIISQFVVLVITAVTMVIKLRGLNITEPSKLFDWQICKTSCRVAIPSCIQQSIVAIGMLCLQSVVNGFGPVVMAGYAAAGKIDNLATVPMSNMGNAVSTFTAQNIGAKKHERVPLGLKAALLTVFGIGVGLAIILFIFGGDLIGLFVKDENASEVVKSGMSFLRITSCLYFLFGCMNSFAGVFRGAGDMKAFLTSYLLNFGVRVLLTFLIAPKVGLPMVAWAIVIGWTIGLVFSIFRFRTGKWKEKKLI